MIAATESVLSPHLVSSREEAMTSRTVPIVAPTIHMSAPSPDDPMELTTPTNSSPQPAPAAHSTNNTPERETDAASAAPSIATSNDGGSASPPDSADAAPKTEPQPQFLAPGSTGLNPPAAAPAVHQPKIVQTAFIHKLYNMLEDPSIQHLISWSNSAESFVMSPSHDFSKVLAQYFKHTNISSFVRQLNMYGFHKVSDVFANGSDSTTLWEFKHGNGNFKRGDLVGLREIKRRASRHSLVHREYNSQKPLPPSQPGTPAETGPVPDGTEPRMSGVDHALYSLESRLQRSEEAMHYMHIKHQAVVETNARLLQFNQELARILMNVVPNTDNPLHRDIVALQGEMQRQADMIRTLDDPHEGPPTSSRHYFSTVDNSPVSPRQVAQDDPRRPALAIPHSGPQNFYRPPVPSNLSASTRRPYGSIGGGIGPGTAQSSSPSSSLRSHLAPPPPVPQHPLAAAGASANNLARRHTAADIRAHGWQPANAHYPPAQAPLPPVQFPPSPNRAVPEEQRIRDSFSTYSLQAASQPRARPETPPPPPLPPFGSGGGGGGSSGSNGHGTGGSNGNGPDLGNWTWGPTNRSSSSLNVKDNSAPPTRRGSMAHILNPTSTAERDEEDGSPRDDDRKRKRIV